MGTGRVEQTLTTSAYLALVTRRYAMVGSRLEMSGARVSNRYKYELGERPLDAVELAVILHALGMDLPAFWHEVGTALPERLQRRGRRGLRAGCEGLAARP